MILPIEFYEEVYSSLGGFSQGVDVELTEIDIEVCFKKAKRTFQQKGHNSYRRNFYLLNVEKDKREYVLNHRENDEIPDFDTIVKVIRPSTSLFNVEDAFSMQLYNEIFNYTTKKSPGEISFLTYELTMWLKESHERYSANAVQFQWDKFRSTLTFYTNPKADEVWILDSYENLRDSEYAEIDWIINWTIAEANIMLGMAYQKFGNVPGPTGDVTLNGRDYIDRGESMKERLLQDIENLVDGAPDYMDIVIG